MTDDILVVSTEEEGKRLDRILGERYSEVHSRSYFQKLIAEERVLLNGEPVKKRVLPKEGDEIEIEFLLEPNLGIHPEDIPLCIIYEDADLLVINKPAGMVVHPAVGNWSGTFVNALLYHCQLEAGEDVRPGIVHRLDKETTGLLIAAKNPLAQQRLIQQFSSREVYKEYKAICLGKPGDRTIDAPIGRHPVNRKNMAVLVEGGRPAISHVRTLATQEKLSLVQVILETGRTHQIRVHLKHINTPVLGDSVYGNAAANKRYGATRQLLHAHRVRFKHPISGRELSLEAPLPPEFSSTLKLPPLV